jgi:hypothetical protein
MKNLLLQCSGTEQEHLGPPGAILYKSAAEGFMNKEAAWQQ